MSFFRRRSEKQKTSSKSDNQKGSGLSRSSSLKNDQTIIHSSSPKLWKNNNERDFGSSPGNGPTIGIQRPHSLLLSSDALNELPTVPPDVLESPARTSSQLSKTFQEIIRDKDGLSCFIDFMKSEKAENLIQFWCDAKSFSAATLMRLRSHSLQNVSKSALHKRRSDSLSRKSNREDVVGAESSPNVCDESTITSGHIDLTKGTVSEEEEKNISTSSTSSTTTTTTTSLTTGSQLSNTGVPSPKDKDDIIRSHLHSSHRIHVPKGVAGDQKSDSSPPAHMSAILLPPSRPTSLSPITSQNQKVKQSVSCSERTDSTLSASDLTRGPHPTRVAAATCDINFLRDSHQERTLPQNGWEKNSVSKRDLPDDYSGLQTDGKLAKPDYEVPIEDCSNTDVQGSSSSQPTSSGEHEEVADKMRKSIERDAVTIFSNYIAKDAPKPIGVDDSLRAETISKICREDGQVDPECFMSCQNSVLSKMEAQYFESFKDSAYYSKHQINVLTCCTVFLPDILLAENALCYFLEYMEQEGASELMQLWLAVANFQQQLTLAKDGYDTDQAQNDAMVIYDKYFSLQATHPMGFDDKLRFTVEENICREGGPLPDCFTEAKDIVLKTLDKMYFSSYLQSQVYYRYLSDLVSTVQMAEDFHHKPKGHRRSESDVSSELSLGSQTTSETGGGAKARNTLLAVDTRKGKKTTTGGGGGASGSGHAPVATAAIEGDFHMTMDMFNPDELWKRTSPGGMSLGCVDELGQFVSNFEHDATDKKKAGGFLKRWKDKEKEQEDMALRIAQMIIKDVHSMTQSSESLVGGVPYSQDAEEGEGR